MFGIMGMMCIYCHFQTDPNCRFDSAFLYCKYCSAPWCKSHMKDFEQAYKAEKRRYDGIRYEDMKDCEYLRGKEFNFCCKACRNPKLSHEKVLHLLPYCLILIHLHYVYRHNSIWIMVIFWVINLI